MELSKYIETMRDVLKDKMDSGIATVDAIMTREGDIQGGCVAVNGKQVSLDNRFPVGNLDEGVRIRFSINVSK